MANFAKPAAGQPALITFYDVTTMFHEFGHGLHGMFATGSIRALSGTMCARDFVEFPSQFNEHWALYPTVLEHYAMNYNTGAPCRGVRREAQACRGLQPGLHGCGSLAAAELDLQWHTLPAGAPPQNPDDFREGRVDRGCT